MKKEPPLICLITPGHAASTPRLIRNADALAEAGYRVHVVAGRYFRPADALDAEIFAKARWTHTLVDYRGGPSVVARKLARRLARRLVLRPAFATTAVAARANHAESRRFAAAAARVPARYFLGHCLSGLPAAAAAAKYRGVPYGFDAEDFHDGETEAAMHDLAESRARRILQSVLLPGCAHVSSASPLIGKRLEEDYGVKSSTLLNAFPLTESPPVPAHPGPITERRPARFYWFSQTIGPGRGLEAVINVIGRMRIPAELHLRGFVSPEYISSLQSVAHLAGLRRSITFLPPGPPAEMARLSAFADLGLSTEESTPPNHDICLGNKIFAYLLAGIPQLLSHTKAQAEFAPSLGDSALLCDMQRIEETAHRLDEFFADEHRVSAARKTSWNLAREQFCWDKEKEKLLALIGSRLPAD